MRERKRSEAEAFLCQANLGREIVRQIERIVELPDTGFLAGGAVASLLFDRFFGGNHPVNDVDLFHVNAEYIPPGPRYAMPSRVIGPRIVTDSYGHLAQHRKGHYAVVATRRKGMLNTVFTSGSGGERRYHGDFENLLEGFDLNCCQVGITRGGSSLVYTDAFRRFLDSRQLQVCYPGTPHHTAIRLAKKASDLQCYCDVPGEMSLLSTFSDLMDRRERELDRIEMVDSPSGKVPLRHWDAGRTPLQNLSCQGYPRFFGAKYRDAYLAQGGALSPHTEIVPFSCDIPRTLSPEHPALLAGSKPGYAKFHVLQHERFVKDLSEGRLFTIRYKAESRADEIAGCGEDFLRSLNAGKFQAVWDKAYRPSERATIRRRAKTVLSAGNDPLIVQAVTEPERFLSEEVHERHVRKVGRMLNEHPEIHDLFASADLGLDEMAKSVQAIRRGVKRHGLLVIGLMESQNRNVLGALREQQGCRIPAYREKAFVTDDLIDHLVEEFLRENHGALAEPADLSGFPHRDSVREIVTAKELVEEGCRMHHCVGGYANAIRGGRTRIFHVEAGGEPSTVQISLRVTPAGPGGVETRQAAVYQHRGTCNRPVSKDAENIGKALAEHLNETPWVKEQPTGTKRKLPLRPDDGGNIPF